MQTQFAEKMNDSLAIWMVLLLAVALRVLNLLSNKAFWGDELFSILLARKPFWDVLYGAMSDVHPPGHLMLLHAFYAVLGGHDWVYRLPSVIAGCTLIYVVYLLGQEFFDRSSALLASFLVAISPYFIQLSNEARSYSLTTLAITFTTYSFIKSFRTSDPRWRRAYLISAMLCVYLNHFAWIWLFMVNVFLLLNRTFKKYFRSHLRIFFYGLPALSLTIYQTLFSKSKLATDLQVADLQRSFSFFPILKKIFAVLWHAATGYGYSGWSKESLAVYSTDLLFWLAVITYVSFLMAVMFAMSKAPKRILLLVLLSSVIPLISLCLLYPTRLESRYLSFLMPPLFIFAAAGFRHLKYGWIGLVPVVILSLYFTFKTLVMSWDPIHRQDYRTMIDYTFKAARENDAVCGLGRYVQYYGSEEKKLDYYDYIHEIAFQKRYARIFLLEPSLYLDPKKDHKRLDSAQRVLKRSGYYLTESINFGKDGVYTFVHIFESQI